MPIQSRPSEEENERMMSSDLDSAESELKLSDILAVWWKTRVRIFLLALAGGVVAAAALLVAFLLRPSQQMATVDVRLLFSGVDKGQYPNGTPFSAQDIVATSILQQVYEQNHLGKFIKFDDFKSSFSVLESNEATERLRREYGPKLDDRRLTSPERSKIEDEFQGKLKSSRTGEFRLVGLLGSGLTNWNRDLVGIVMNDILNTWVLDARGKGVFKFDLNVYSENIVSDLETYQEDQLIFIDRLRVTISRIIQNIRALEEIPGASLLRVGDRKLSLGELDVALQDDLRFKIGVLHNAIYSYGFYRNRALAESYIDDQLFSLDLDNKAGESRVKVIDDALTSYSANRQGAGAQRIEGTAAQVGTTPSISFGGGTMIPQLGESFLDRVINLSTQNSDVAFRQDLSRQTIDLGKGIVDIDRERKIYQRMKDAITDPNVQARPDRAEVSKWVEEQLHLLVPRLKDTLHYVQLVNDEISARLLQPVTVYTVVQPMHIEKVAMISLFKLAALIAFAWCIYMGAVFVLLAMVSRHSAAP